MWVSREPNLDPLDLERQRGGEFGAGRTLGSGAEEEAGPLPPFVAAGAGAVVEVGELELFPKFLSLDPLVDELELMLESNRAPLDEGAAAKISF